MEDTGVHRNYKEIGEKIWNGDYLGKGGALELASREFLNINRWFQHGPKESKELREDKIETSLMFASTLFSFIGHCVAQIKKLKFQYFYFGIKELWNLKAIINKMLKNGSPRYFDSSQKEVFIAYLLICRWMTPFSFFNYRQLAIALGEGVLASSDRDLPDATSLLVGARLSRLLFYSNSKYEKMQVMMAIHLPYIQTKLGWKTINRLARLIGDKEMVARSASLADSKDVMIKSGK